MHNVYQIILREIAVEPNKISLKMKCKSFVNQWSLFVRMSQGCTVFKTITTSLSIATGRCSKRILLIVQQSLPVIYYLPRGTCQESWMKRSFPSKVWWRRCPDDWHAHSKEDSISYRLYHWRPKAFGSSSTFNTCCEEPKTITAQSEGIIKTESPMSAGSLGSFLQLLGTLTKSESFL